MDYWTRWFFDIFSDNATENCHSLLEFNNPWRTTFWKCQFYTKLLACFFFEYGAKNYCWDYVHQSTKDLVVLRAVYSNATHQSENEFLKGLFCASHQICARETALWKWKYIYKINFTNFFKSLLWSPLITADQKIRKSPSQNYEILFFWKIQE